MSTKEQRTWEDGVLDTLEQLNKADHHVHSRILLSVMSPSVYRRARDTKRLKSTGISRVARITKHDPTASVFIAGNQTRH